MHLMSFCEILLLKSRSSSITILWILNKCKKSFQILLWLWIWWMLFNSYIIYNEFIVWVFCPACLACSVAITAIAILSAIWIKDKN